MKAMTWVLSGLLLAIAPVGSLLAQAPGGGSAPAGRLEDEKAIRAGVAAFVAAFDKRDAKAIAGLFTEQGEAIDLGGEAIRGRGPIEAHYASRFEGELVDKLEVTIDLIHFLAPEVARQDGRTKLIPAGGGLASTAKYTATYLKSGGRWLVASLRELEDPTITPHDRLMELEWLVGDWVEETGDAVISTSTAWSEDGNFLLRTFEVRSGSDGNLKGTQRLGWDPLTQQIKSWVFDSRGGFGEGHWSRSGESWVIKSTGVHPDGVTTSATQTLTRVNRDRLHWKSTDRTLGGETRDDLHEVLMVRKPPQPK